MAAQVLKALKAAAGSAKVAGSVWQMMVAPLHLDDLRKMKSPALPILEKWQTVKRFAPLDPAMATHDLVHNAVSIFPHPTPCLVCLAACPCADAGDSRKRLQSHRSSCSILIPAVQAWNTHEASNLLCR